ncbi:hypothetical protein ACOSQ4_001604 [Xanthoceras sorbifolium]
MEESSVQKSVKRLEEVSTGVLGMGPELEALTFAGLQIVEAREGFLRCNFIVPMLVADKIGNWEVGAMATLIDVMGGAAIYSLAADHIPVSVDLSISFYSTAKMQEEVEIEARRSEERRERPGAEMEESILEKTVKRLNDLSKGELGHGLEAITVTAIQIVEARHGFLRCFFTVPITVTDKDGNWHAGAVATLIDVIGATAVYSLAGYVHVSVDFSISFYSTAKIQEEVEIEAKVVGYRGKLPCVEVDIRRKDNGELIALGRQWMALHKTSSQVQSKL